ncbi:MAG: LysM peptidoglycan-binding domain-containing protein [Proteobacteria bacterium]|nr:LysM peptidoglycan-binding domain-containing protein [Pseudomonadota bacterium]
MSKMGRWFIIAAMMLITSPAMGQEATPEAAPAGGASAGESGGDSGGGLQVDTRQKIARVNGLSTSYASGKSSSYKNRSGSDVRTHLVVDGDTLWQISETYLEDPFMWPALWSYNPQVTNPHWIYPGDVIYLEPYQAELVEEVVETETPLVNITPGVGRGVIAVPGIYLSKLPDELGHVLYSNEEKHMLTFNDEVNVDWVDIEMRKKVSVGQRFVVFSEAHPVRDENDDNMAYKLIRAGLIELVDVREDGLSTGRVIHAYREIERGDLIIPEMDLAFTMTRTPNSNNMEGRIIDTIDTTSQLGEQQYVIINRGSQDGVVPGNSFFIFEQREGLNRLPEGESNTQYATESDRKTEDDEDRDLRDGDIHRDDSHSWVLGYETRAPEFPKRKDLSDIYGDREYTTADLPIHKVGEVLVINVQEQFSTGIIVDNSREIPLDTRLVMIKGE